MSRVEEALRFATGKRWTRRFRDGDAFLTPPTTIGVTTQYLWPSLVFDTYKRIRANFFAARHLARELAKDVLEERKRYAGLARDCDVLIGRIQALEKEVDRLDPVGTPAQRARPPLIGSVAERASRLARRTIVTSGDGVHEPEYWNGGCIKGVDVPKGTGVRCVRLEDDDTKGTS